MGRRFKRKTDEETSYWLSYSDMMAGLLLVFVIIISLTVLHAKIQYDEKQLELAGKEKELVIQSKELENERLTVADQQAVLNAQEAKLSEQEAKLTEQAEELAAQKSRLNDQENTLSRQSSLLKELQDIMDSQQEQLDRIIGVRSDLIEALKDEFANSNLEISVDANTGAITMNSGILFEYNKSELIDTGKAFLDEFFPRYTKILLSPRFRDYISEIVIEGHTDTTGNYMFNLELSQKRAYSVSSHCMSESVKNLTEEELRLLQNVVATSGKSFADPILKADGSVDMDASRRVEILFRLKDEEMIREMLEILNETEEEKNGPKAGTKEEAGAGTKTALKNAPESGPKVGSKAETIKGEPKT